MEPPGGGREGTPHLLDVLSGTAMGPDVKIHMESVVCKVRGVAQRAGRRRGRGGHTF